MANATPEPFDTRAQFDTAEGPSYGPAPDEALLAERVRQLAQADAASGAYDDPFARAHQGPLPSERYIERQVDRLIEESELHALDAEAMDRGHEFPIQYGDEIADREDAQLQDNLSSLNADIETVKTTLDDAIAEEAAAKDALTGKDRWRDGAKFTAAVPPRPVLTAKESQSLSAARKALRWRSERINRWMVDIGFTLAGAIPDYIILTVIFGTALRTDDVFETAALAFGATASGVVGPHVIGLLLAKIVRGAKFTVAMMIAIAVLTAFWIGVASQVATLRTTAERTRVLDRLAADQGIPTTEVDLTGHFDPLAQWIIWFMLVLAIGIVVIGLKIAFSNPALSSIVASHTAITLAGLRLANLTGRRDRILEKLAIRRDVVAITQKQFDAQPAVLDALREELIALYRTSFIAALANPSMTGHLATPTTQPVQRPQGGVTP